MWSWSDRRLAEELYEDRRGMVEVSMQREAAPEGAASLCPLISVRKTEKRGKPGRDGAKDRHRPDRGGQAFRLFTQAATSCAEAPAGSRLPGFQAAVLAVCRRMASVLPIPLPPEVAKGITVLPVRS